VIMNATLIPPYEEWASLLTANLQGGESLIAILGEARILSLRREVVAAAREYTTHLFAVAQRLKIPLSGVPAIPEQPGAIIMAGHQPVIYHEGILEKIRRLADLSRSTGALAINVAIDTDEGDGGRVLWPLVQGEDLLIKQRSISTEGTVYREQGCKPADDVVSIFSEMRKDLETSGRSDLGASVDHIARIYASLEGQSIAVANAIARMALCGGGYFEVPLSHLMQLPTLVGIVQELFVDGGRFVATYNATLDTYRREHKIKNVANPFPNMAVDEEVVEMPFWLLKNHRREPVKVPISKLSTYLQGKEVAPRGGVVTLLLRGLCSDLFIHGLGGAKYDPFVDELAAAYWKVSLPRFVVASATRYLFPEVVRRFTHARDMRARYKEIISHTERFIGQGLFTSDEETQLSSFIERRRELIVEMSSVTGAEVRSRIAHDLNGLNRSLKGVVDSSSLAHTLAEGAIDEARLSRWSCREFPFFLFLGLVGEPSTGC